MASPSVLVGSIVGMGGVYGFIKSGSVISMVMGLLSAVVLIYSGYRIPSRSGYLISIGYSLFLGAMMGMKYLNSAKFMPSGLVATLSISLCLYNTFLYLNE